MDPLTLSTNTCVIGGRIFHLLIRPREGSCVESEAILREVVVDEGRQSISVRTCCMLPVLSGDRRDQQEYAMCVIEGGEENSKKLLFILGAPRKAGYSPSEAVIISDLDLEAPVLKVCKLSREPMPPRDIKLYSNIYMAPSRGNEVVIMSEVDPSIYVAKIEVRRPTVSFRRYRDTPRGVILRTVPVPVYTSRRVPMGTLRAFGGYFVAAQREGDSGHVTDIKVSGSEEMVSTLYREFPRRYMTSAAAWAPGVTFVFGGIAARPTNDLVAYVDAVLEGGESESGDSDGLGGTGNAGGQGRVDDIDDMRSAEGELQFSKQVVVFQKTGDWPPADALSFLLCRDDVLYIMGGIGSRSVYRIRIDELQQSVGRSEEEDNEGQSV